MVKIYQVRSIGNPMGVGPREFGDLPQLGGWKLKVFNPQRCPLVNKFQILGIFGALRISDFNEKMEWDPNPNGPRLVSCDFDLLDTQVDV